MPVRQRAVAALPTLMRALRKEAPPKPHPALPSLRRAFSLYDQINIITDVPEDQLRFHEFDDTGFKVNGVRYEGSLLCVGNLLMSWTPQKFSDITTERASLGESAFPPFVLFWRREITMTNDHPSASTKKTGLPVIFYVMLWILLLTRKRQYRLCLIRIIVSREGLDAFTSAFLNGCPHRIGLVVGSICCLMRTVSF
ncbi:hypothetical protein ACS0TY_003441 [Phlomoides rotata]